MKRNAAAIILFLLAACIGQERLDAQTRTSAGPDLRVYAEDLLTKPVGENWPSYNGDYTGRRFSSLSEINSTNVIQLRAAWVFHPGNSQRLEATPVVIRGVMYVTSANDVFALDARTGRALWHYSRPISSGLLDDSAGHINRGVAVRENFVYSETDDAHLLCLGQFDLGRTIRGQS
jgi:alcohol dehydrogenase (cytochrome c)